MRRFRQTLPNEESEQILREMINGVLALTGVEDYPYAVPVSYVYDGQFIYIHSAIEGHKIDCLRNNPKISFCVIKEDNIIPEEFTTYYKSVIVFGTISFITKESDKIYALKALADKYSPNIDSDGEIKKCLSHVAIIRISIDSFSGKESLELTRKRLKSES